MRQNNSRNMQCMYTELVSCARKLTLKAFGPSEALLGDEELGKQHFWLDVISGPF